MTPMEISQVLGNVGEFVGSIAVVATLLYLAIQVREAGGLPALTSPGSGLVYAASWFMGNSFPGTMISGAGGRYSKRAVRPDRVVVDAPLLDEHLRFSQRVEDLSVEQFIAQLAVEGFAITILPGASRSDVNGRRTEPFQPPLEPLGDHLRAIVRADVFWDAMGFHQIREHIDCIPGPDAPGDMDRQAPAGVFIDHHHQLERAAVIGPVEYEVPGPHMVGPLGAQPDAGTVVEPQPASFRLLRRDFEALTAPDAHHPAMTDLPALGLE